MHHPIICMYIVYVFYVPHMSFSISYPQFGYGSGHIQAPGRRCCGGAGGIYRVRRPGDAGDRSGADRFGCVGAVQMYNVKQVICEQYVNNDNINQWSKITSLEVSSWETLLVL